MPHRQAPPHLINTQMIAAVYIHREEGIYDTQGINAFSVGSCDVEWYLGIPHIPSAYTLLLVVLRY